MIGFEVIAPKPRPFEWRRKRQRTVKRGIVRASRSVALAARWLATLPFAVGHDPFALARHHHDHGNFAELFPDAGVDAGRSGLADKLAAPRLQLDVGLRPAQPRDDQADKN